MLSRLRGKRELQLEITATSEDVEQIEQGPVITVKPKGRVELRLLDD